MPCAIAAQQPTLAMGGYTRRRELFTDPYRVVRSTDSSGREAIISCGAVLDHFQTAMAAADGTPRSMNSPTRIGSSTWRRFVSRRSIT